MSPSTRSSNNRAAEAESQSRPSSSATDWKDCESSTDEWWWDEKLEEPQSHRSKARKKGPPSEDPEFSKPGTRAKSKHRSESKEDHTSDKPRKKRPGPNCTPEPLKETPNPAKQFLKDSYQAQPNKVDRDARSEERRERQKRKEARHAARRPRKARQAEEARQRRQARAAQQSRQPGDYQAYTYTQFINFIGTEQERQALGRALYGAEYDALHRARRAFHAHPESSPFPKPKMSVVCTQKHCMKADSLRCCHHDLERTLHGSGKFSPAWLRKERLLWHPDKFAGKGNAAVYAADMFKMIQRMIDGPSRSR